MQKVLSIGDREKVVRLFGPRECFLKQLREAFGLKLVARNGELSIDGPAPAVSRCQEVLRAMQDRVDKGQALSRELLGQLIEQQDLAGGRTAEKWREGAAVEGFQTGRTTRPKSKGQAAYIKAMLNNDVVFCIGPAGTGKTYLAVAVALNYLKNNQLNRIVLSRPAVEAGEHLGFLPGDIRAKVNPYLRPLYDALHDLMDVSQVTRYIENDLIEILPLAFIRGRTLDDAFIILDEAQNCTVKQMKTFLTRLGVGSRLVVTGDITQIDLPDRRSSGLVDAHRRLDGIPGIAIVELSEYDIVRHPLVSEIVRAYRRRIDAVSEDVPDEENGNHAAQEEGKSAARRSTRESGKG